MTLVSVVVPVYCNATSLPDLMEHFRQLAESNPNESFEFVFVDDGSFDNSFEVLQGLAQQDARIRAVKLSRNFGSNPAVLAGLGQASGDVIAAISADLQDPPELIGDMLERWRQGAKVVLAARHTRDDPGLTAMISDVFYWLFRRFAIKTMPKRGFDFFLIDRQVCALINSIQENNAYLMGLILWLGFNPQVLYYHRRPREKLYGRSMWTLARKIDYFADSFVAFSYAPIRAASLLGIALSFSGVIYALAVLLRRIFFDTPLVGWTSIMMVLLIVSGAQLLMTGILGEYLWRNLDETRRRPRFIVDRIVQASPDTENRYIHHETRR